MKIRLAFGLFLSGLAAAEEPRIEFTGMIATGSAVRFSLREIATGNSSWRQIGDTFLGYAITKFEVADETLILTKDGIPIRLKLVAAKIQNGMPAEASALISAIRKNLQTIAAAADRVYLEQGKTTTSFAELVGRGKTLPELQVLDGEKYEQLELKSHIQVFSVRTAGGHVVTFDKNPNRPATHILKAGETLAGISRESGVPMKQLIELNSIVDPGKLKVGQSIRLK